MLGSFGRIHISVTLGLNSAILLITFLQCSTAFISVQNTELGVSSEVENCEFLIILYMVSSVVV